MTLELDTLADLARAHLPSVRFVTVSGAHLYGFPSADSDIDLRGCYQLPLEDVIGLRRPVETRDLKLDLAGREVELVAHEVGKYLRLLCKHNGYILEQIFSPLVVLGQDFLDQLRPLAQPLHHEELLPALPGLPPDPAQAAGKGSGQEGQDAALRLPRRADRHPSAPNGRGAGEHRRTEP